jgi:hypothetical protein
MTMTNLTIATVAADLGADLGHWPADVLIPVVSGEPQAQGDLLVLPADGFAPAAVRPLPAAGETVLTGRGGNAHCLAAGAGVVCWEPTGRGRQTLGTLTVAPGAVAYLFHAPEHGPRRLSEHEPLAVGTGTYVVRRQREQRDEIALVAD